MTYARLPIKSGMTVEGIPGQARDDELFYWFKISVWFVGVKNLVAVHNSDEIFCVGEIDDVVSVARKHVHCLDLIS